MAAEKSLSKVATRLIEMARNLALMQLKAWKDAVLDLENTRVIVFDPQRGELQVT